MRNYFLDKARFKIDLLFNSVFSRLFGDLSSPHYVCNAHKNKYARELDSNVLVFVHPFFLECVSDCFNNSYYSNYKHVINESLKIKGWSAAWFTFPQIYNEGKKLLEKGVFSKAFFTEYKSGVPLIEEEINEFMDKRVVVLGSYAEWCVDELINSFINNGVTDVSVLSEGVLFAERYLHGVNKSNDELFRINQESGEMVKARVIHFSDLSSLLK